MPINGKNNNLNVGPKRDKIAKDIINASKSRNSKNLSFVVPDQQFHFRKTGATSLLKNHKTHGIISHGSVI